MKKIIFLVMLLVVGYAAQANVIDTPRIYQPNANASKDIAAAIAKAKIEGKFVLIQAGGNWCGWCIRFHRLSTSDKNIDSLINANFVVYHLNYSSENRNEAIFKQYSFPQRFGFPVFLVLDANGKLLHTQNSAYLEQDKGYSKEKVTEFLNHWKPAALNEKNYHNK